MYERADDVLSNWLDCVNSGNLEGVLSLYNEGAVLLPTFSSEVRNDPEGIRRYFVKVSSTNEEVIVEVIPGTLIVQEISDSVFSLGGIYSWEFLTKGVRSKIMARFTYTVDISLKSPIIHHHSSLLPED